LAVRYAIGACIVNGTLMNADYAERSAGLTFSSGQANSMRGAGFLAHSRPGSR
jgi:hypothetical protein